VAGSGFYNPMVAKVVVKDSKWKACGYIKYHSAHHGDHR
jgi:hypothetical protein